MKQVISVGYGRANFSNNSATLAAFVVEPEFARDYPGKKFPLRGKPQAFPTTKYPEVSGQLFLATMDAEDGAVIMVQAQHRANSISVFDGAVFLRLRETGPNYAINAVLPAYRESTVGDSFVVFQGRADIVGIDELADLGIRPTRSWAECFMDAEELEKCFDIRELSGEIAPKPRYEIATSLSGKQVQLNTAVPSRRVKVRNPVGG